MGNTDMNIMIIIVLKDRVGRSERDLSLAH